MKRCAVIGEKRGRLFCIIVKSRYCVQVFFSRYLYVMKRDAKKV